MDDARRKFEEFLRRYPNHRLAPEARAKLQSLHELAAQKYLDDAEFYRRRGQANSAKWMYRAIIRLYGDTAAADEARARLREMGEEP
jgi:outer membrane protein assembly factor BamD (BamD/ComL family)